VLQIRLDSDSLSMIVACIGTSLSAYIYTWQSNQEVEEEIAQSRHRPGQRRGATDAELRKARRDVVIGMLFSNPIFYFIILSTGATLRPAGPTEIESATQAAAALEPPAGAGAKYLFALGVVSVDFLAAPVMTTGAAYDLMQGIRSNGSLHARPGKAKSFYGTIAAVTVAAVGLNFLGFNTMRALVWSGIVQGFSVPPLHFLTMLMANATAVMGNRVNGGLTNLLG
jgi:Mn2+/Fe2+ NRAMP family transporter